MDHGPSADRPGAGIARLTALSDGVFAIAMTLLVLDVSVPPGLDDRRFHEELRQAVPNLAAYALSFLVLAQFWRDHRYVLGKVAVTDIRIVHLTLLGLALIALMPFPTALLAEYGDTQPAAVAAYAGGAAAVNAVHLAMLHESARKVERWDGVRRLAALDLGASAAVLAASVPVAFASPVAGMLVWLVLVPFKAAVGVRQSRAAREPGADPLD